MYEMVSSKSLFLIFSVDLLHAFQDCDQGVYIRYRTTGKLRFSAKSKTFHALDCNMITQTGQEM